MSEESVRPMTFDSESSYSRLPKRVAPTSKVAPKPTRTQKAIEVILFTVFGLTIALAGVALYATNRPEHRRVPNRFAAGLQADRVNVLLIGSSLRTRNGGGHDVKIDSLMLFSVQPSTGRAALMSIPVDLWVKVGRYGQRPLRAAHTVGDASGYPGAGIGLTVDTVQNIIDEPVHAYARVSIGDIQRVVDVLGGIDVQIERGVYEYRQKQRFRRGVQHLNGGLATRYAYSPHMTGFAADRFAREKRQQDVIVAAVGKILHDERTDFGKIEPLFGSLTATNLTREQTMRLVSALRHTEEIRRISFEPYLDAIDVSSVAYRGEAVGPRGRSDYGTLQRIADAAFDAGVARVH